MVTGEQTENPSAPQLRPQTVTGAQRDRSLYDADPQTAMQALTVHRGPVLVDLDETIYLRNSTEDFIDLACPGLLAALLLRVLDFVRPWRWTGGDPTRDWWRVRLVGLLFPWTYARWRAAVPRLAREFANEELIQALHRRGGELVVLTAGFRPIVEPLIAALGLSPTQVIAAGLASFADRRNGKLPAALRGVGAESVRASLFLTDSVDDLPLLERCGRPLRTSWPRARFQRALGRIYVPGEYIAQVKRPSERYIWRVVVNEDLAVWILSSIALAPHPWLHILGLTALLASFWTIYERGYVDNDWAAHHLESDGKLSATYWTAGVATPAVQPWIWAALTGAVGVYLVRWPLVVPLDLLKWAAVLAATFAIFKLYNRLNKLTRTWLYLVLQLARAGCFLALVPISAAGAAALGAVVLARWVPYYIYRLGVGNWPQTQANLMRLLFYMVLATLFAAAYWVSIVNWTALVLLCWCVFRARREIAALARDSRRIDRGEAP